MKFALVNPNWEFSGSTYFGCREPHYPLELLFAAQKLRGAGHQALVLDAHQENLSLQQAQASVSRFAPDFLVVTTAPTYLFWRCPQPELRIPQQWLAGLGTGAVTVAIGPHASATPAAVLRKTGCKVAMRGEPDEKLAELATRPWCEIAGCCWRDEEGLHLSPHLAAANLREMQALDFSDYPVERRSHRHHVFHGEGR